jgi:Trk K+ transport system NAD-binding subunit
VQRCLVVADTKEAARRIRRLGFESVSVETTLLETLTNLVERPTAFQAIASDGPVTVDETAVENPAVTGQPLRTLWLPGRCLVALVRRDGALFAPHGDTVLRTGDRAVLVGDTESVQDALALLGGSPGARAVRPPEHRAG